MLGKCVGFCISLYQRYMSPFLPCRCRFHPSCSQYAKEAFITFSVMKASWLTIKRLLRCQPLSRSLTPFDPLPRKDTFSHE